MATMTAAFYDGNGKMELHDHPRPTAGPGQAVIRIRACGVCGTDLQMNVDKDAPDAQPAGHEVAGEVIEFGDGVDPGLLGQRVAVESVGLARMCGTCWFCRQGQFRACRNPAPAVGGGFADYMVRNATAFCPMPDELSWDEGALVEPFAVSIHGVRRGYLSAGETVAVLGSGTIGLMAIAGARAMGAGKIIATARYERQAAMAKALGADEAVSDSGPEFRAAIDECTDGRGADLTIETIGGHGGETVQQSLDVTRVLGRIVILGGHRRPITLDYILPLKAEHSIIFSNCYSVIDGRHDYELAMEMMASGQADIEQVVSHRYPLAQIQDAFDTASDKSSGSVKVQIQQD